MTHTKTNVKEYVRSELEERVLANLDVILDALNIDYNENGQRFFFPCPIHLSDNYNSMSIYKDTGVCLCFTMGCLPKGENFIFDFVAKTLKSSKKEAIDFCQKVLKGLSPEIIDRPTIEKIDYRVKEVERSSILPYVDPNIEFYLRRGYTRKILEKYDIFICKKKTSNLYGRITIPVYNDEHTKAIGFLGRSIHPKCNLCNKYHHKNVCCPRTTYEIIKSEKWLNSRGMARNKLLFNYWYAKDEIERRKEVILVESPGNAMKVSQAGFEWVVGIFGTILSENQVAKLDKLGVKRIYLGMDKDKAGEAALEKIQQQLSKYETIPLIPPINDYGDMSTDEIISFFNSKSICF